MFRVCKATWRKVFQRLLFYASPAPLVLAPRLFARLIRTFLIHAELIFPARTEEAAAVAVPMSGTAA